MLLLYISIYTYCETMTATSALNNHVFDYTKRHTICAVFLCVTHSMRYFGINVFLTCAILYSFAF